MLRVSALPHALGSACLALPRVFSSYALLPPRKHREAGRLGLRGITQCRAVGSGEPGCSCWWGRSPDPSPPPTQFNNLGQRKLPISVVFWVPVRLNRVTVWDQPQVTFSQVNPAGPQPWTQLLPPQPWSFLTGLWSPLLPFGAISDPLVDLGCLTCQRADPGALTCFCPHRVPPSSEPFQELLYRGDRPPSL